MFEKIIDKIREKCKFFRKFLIFWRDYWETKEYNMDGYSGGSGAETPEWRKFFNNLSKLVMKNLKNYSLYKNFMNFLRQFSQKYKTNWKFYPTRRFGGRSPPPPDASELLWFFPKFSFCHFNFSRKFAGRPLRPKLIIH